jgi:hypothetical protein
MHSLFIFPDSTNGFKETAIIATTAKRIVERLSHQARRGQVDNTSNGKCRLIHNDRVHLLLHYGKVRGCMGVA